MKRQTTFKAILLAASSVLLLTAPASFADEAGSVAQFSASAEVSDFQPDYTPIQKFSTAFASDQRGRTKVSYAAVSEQGKSFMAGYMRYLANVPVSTLSRNDQLAFWLNTRNMMVIDAMTDSGSRRRMSSERGTLAKPGKMWTEKRITVEGVELSLQDIEKDIILANFADNPNVIFGLYQGTSGGPSFHKTGFSGANVDAELEAVARDYVGSANGAKVSWGKPQLPAIVDWYQDAVYGGDTSVAATHIASLSGGSVAEKLTSAEQISVRKFSYSSDELILRQQGGFDASSSTGRSVGGAGNAGFGGGGGGGS